MAERDTPRHPGRPTTACRCSRASSSLAVDPLGKIASNPCEGIKQLYSDDRSEIIWTDADIAQIKAPARPRSADAVDLAAHTGLRARRSAEAVLVPRRRRRHRHRDRQEQHRREAIIPLYEGLREVLARIPKRSTTILTNSRGRPWTKDGFGTSFNKAKKRAGLAERDLHFHDLRGTAATRFYVAGLPERVIAEIMGWEEEHVAKIIRRYVGRTAATKAIIRSTQSSRKENIACKTTCKTGR